MNTPLHCTAARTNGLAPRDGRRGQGWVSVKLAIVVAVTVLAGAALVLGWCHADRAPAHRHHPANAAETR